jgi:hypothetical protein
MATLSRTRFKSFGSTAELLVGPHQVRFIIHKELLEHYSLFFTAALNGCFVEGLEQCVKLPEERLDAFEHFVHWLYTQQLDNSLYKDGKPTYFLLLDIYSLADRLCVEKLRNQTVDKIAELSEQTNSVLTPSDTYILYDTIRDSSPLRKLVLDLFAFKKTDNLLANHPDDWHPTFLKELCVKMKKPGYIAMARHDIKTWKPASWSLTKACDVCRTVLKPQAPANICLGCQRAFCNVCYSRGGAMSTYDWPDDCSCKPWKRNICLAYHEHQDTPACGSENPDNTEGVHG